MKTKRPSLEQIIRKLREVEGMLSARCAAVSRPRAAAPAWTSGPGSANQKQRPVPVGTGRVWLRRYNRFSNRNPDGRR